MDAAWLPCALALIIGTYLCLPAVNADNTFGDLGIPGEEGDIGFQGFPGQKGDRGFSGMPGRKGEIGDIGLPGMLGVKGDRGQSGPPGVPGVKGDVGFQGMAGMKGARGDSGFTGMTGEKGDRGFNGEPGEKGVMGYSGMKGEKGDSGFSELDHSNTGYIKNTPQTVLNTPAFLLGSIQSVNELNIYMNKGGKDSRGEREDEKKAGYSGGKGDRGDRGERMPGPVGPPGIATIVQEDHHLLAAPREDLASTYGMSYNPAKASCEYAPASLGSGPYVMYPRHPFMVYCNMENRATCLMTRSMSSNEIENRALNYQDMHESFWSSNLSLGILDLYHLTRPQLNWLQKQSTHIELKLRYHCKNSVPNPSSERALQLLTWNDIVIGPNPTINSPFHYTISPEVDECKDFEGDTDTWAKTDIILKTDVVSRLPIVDFYIQDIRYGDQLFFIEVLELCFSF